MKAGEVFKLLAKGIHPETGELIPGGSVVHFPEAIRLLYSLAEEFADDIFPQIKRK